MSRVNVILLKNNFLFFARINFRAYAFARNDWDDDSTVLDEKHPNFEVEDFNKDVVTCGIQNVNHIINMQNSI